MKMLIHTNQIRFRCGKDGEREASGGRDGRLSSGWQLVRVTSSQIDRPVP